MNNIGYLTSDRTENGDSLFTPYYAVDHIIKYLQKIKLYGVHLIWKNGRHLV